MLYLNLELLLNQPLYLDSSKDYMENKYGKEGARNRIFVTTDKFRAFVRIGPKEGYTTFAIPRILEAGILCLLL